MVLVHFLGHFFKTSFIHGIYTCTHTHAYIQRESTAPPTARPWLGAVSAESHVIDVVPWERSAPFSQKQRWRGKYRLRETACSYLVSDFSPFRYHLHYFMLNLVIDIYIFEETIFCLFVHFFSVEIIVFIYNVPNNFKRYFFMFRTLIQ